MQCRVFLSAIALAFGSVAGADVLRVNPEGTGDYPTIQAAIAAAADGDMVELADGVFLGDGNRDMDFLGKALTVQSASGEPEHCVIDCGSAGWEDAHRAFQFITGEGPGSVLRGVKIRNGLAEEGGAIYCEDSAPTIDHCVFSDNVGDGAAIRLQRSAARITNCDFLDNQGGTAGAILGCWPPGPSLEGCHFERNSCGYGGAGVYF